MVGNTVPEAWMPRLASAIVGAVREFGARRLRREPVVAFALGCFPWHGTIELSVLTADELDADPVLLEPGELAAWHHYNFAVGLSAWEPELGRLMSEGYRASGDADRAATVAAFLRACAAAVASPEVAAALASLERDPRFTIGVAHPDDGREFYPPGREAGVPPGVVT